MIVNEFTLEIPNRLNSLNRINSHLFDSLDNIFLTIEYLIRSVNCSNKKRIKIANITR